MRTLSKIFFVFLINSIVAFSATNIETIKIVVSEKGFEPSTIKTNTNKEIILALTRTTDATCATEIIIPSKKLKKILPLNKTVDIKLGKLKKGQISFSCGMDMLNGVINVQ